MKEDDEDNESEVDFPIPKGYKPPASSEEGKEFTAVATFRVDDDMMTITKIEGVPISSEKPEKEEEGPETSPAMMSALQQPAATNASSGMPAAATY